MGMNAPISTKFHMVVLLRIPDSKIIVPICDTQNFFIQTAFKLRNSYLANVNVAMFCSLQQEKEHAN